MCFIDFCNCNVIVSKRKVHPRVPDFLYVFFVVAIQLCCLNNVNGQTSVGLAHQVIPASPESASIAKYINFPVSHSTGIPEISIPLYEIKVGDIVVPITLSYHSSGLKVNEEITWAGSGWTLFAEPSITRSVQGNPDEHTTIGYLDNVQPNYGAGWTTYLDNLDQRLHDETPDEFYYKLSDQSGRFYFSKPLKSSDGHSILTLPYRPLKIDYKSPKRFQIVDDRGLLYRFGLSSSNVEYTEQTFGDSRSPITTWKGTEIVSPSGKDSVVFSYHNYHTTMRGQYSDHVMVEDSINVGWTTLFTVLPNCDGPLPLIKEVRGGVGTIWKLDSSGNKELAHCGDYTSYGTAYNTRTIHLREIRFPNGKLIFEKTYNNRLSKIKVYQYDSIIREIEFFQGNFPAGSGNPRAKLDSIHIKGASEVVERYQFQYHNANNNFPDRYFAREMDFWGYYTGPANYDIPTSIVPLTHMRSMYQYITSQAYDISYTIGSADRNPHPSYPMQGMLTKILYPQGGSTSFEYESNRYLDYGVIKLGPGIRVRKIHHIDSKTMNRITYLYRYGKDGNGGGFLKRKITEEQYMSERLNYYMGNISTTDPRYITRVRTYHSDMLDDVFHSNTGTAVVYNEVGISQLSNNIDTLGKTVYKYRYNDLDFAEPLKVEGTPITIDPKGDWNIGQLLSEAIYSYDLGFTGSPRFKLEKYVGYGYDPPINWQAIPVGKVYRRIHALNLTGPVYRLVNEYDFVYINYNIWTGAVLKSSDTTIFYDGHEPIKIVNSYNYDSYSLKPTSITTADGSGATKEVIYRYPNTMSFSDNAKEQARIRLVNENRVSTVLRKETNKNSTTRVEGTDYLTYSNGFTKQANVFIQTDAVSTRDIIRYLSYDPDGNIAEEQNGEYGAVTTYIWGYNGQLPILKITGASLADVTSVLGTVTVNNFRFGSITDNSIKNAADILRNNSLTTNALVENYTYRPLVGMTSKTDARSDSQFYIYDSFNRLTAVRDHDGNIIKTYAYNYSGPVADCNCYIPIVYYNKLRSQTFITECTVGTGSVETYVVPAGFYSSMISQAHADSKADWKIYILGQDYANGVGSCDP